MVSRELKDLIKSGKITGLQTEEQKDQLQKVRENELKESFAPFSEWIARGAMSHTSVYPTLNEVSEETARACRSIMRIAREKDEYPSECIADGCKAVGADENCVIEELDYFSLGLDITKKWDYIE